MLITQVYTVTTNQVCENQYPLFIFRIVTFVCRDKLKAYGSTSIKFVMLEITCSYGFRSLLKYLLKLVMQINIQYLSLTSTNKLSDKEFF